MIKSIGFLSIGFIIGFALGTTENEEKLKIYFDNWIEKIKLSGENSSDILINVLRNIEGIDTDEMGININKLIDLIRERVDELIDSKSEAEMIKSKADKLKEKIQKRKTLETEVKIDE